jgi:hypothetical protein
MGSLIDRRKKMVRKIFVFLILMPVLVAAQTGAKKDIWEPLRFLEGTWVGETPGVSEVTQTYQFVLKGKFLHMKTRSVFEPTEKNPEGEVHEDFGIFSYDQGRKTFMMRGFYVEGFVNTYVMENMSEDGKSFTFLTEHVENAPEGTKAKLEFKVISTGEIEQSFHVAFPGREFSCLFINNLKKQK